MPHSLHDQVLISTAQMSCRTNGLLYFHLLGFDVGAVAHLHHLSAHKLC